MNSRWLLNELEKAVAVGVRWLRGVFRPRAALALAAILLALMLAREGPDSGPAGVPAPSLSAAQAFRALGTQVRLVYSRSRRAIIDLRLYYELYRLAEQRPAEAAPPPPKPAPTCVRLPVPHLPLPAESASKCNT